MLLVLSNGRRLNVRRFLVEICHVGTSNRPPENLQAANGRYLSALIVLNKNCQRIDALIFYEFEQYGFLHIFGGDVNGLGRIHFVLIFEAQILPVHIKMNLTGVALRIPPLVEFDKLNRFDL
jgi:hypothetical protein